MFPEAVHHFFSLVERVFLGEVQPPDKSGSARLEEIRKGCP